MASGRNCLKACREFSPDLVLMDPDCSDTDGIQLISLLKQEYKTNVLVLTPKDDLRSQYISAGAIDVINKPDLKDIREDFYEKLRSKIKELSLGQAQSRSMPHSQQEQAPDRTEESDTTHRNFKVLCVGTSTGGPGTVQKIFSNLGKDFPLPVLFVQHVDEGTDKKMVEWLNNECPNIKVVLAKDGSDIKNGVIYMAPAGYHLEVTIHKLKRHPVLHLSNDPEEHFLRPSVNHLFRSCATVYNTACLAVLLTGMGRDGADGLKEILDSGGYTIAESEDSCIVYGMPKAAVELNAAREVLHKDQMAQRILKLVGKAL